MYYVICKAYLIARQHSTISSANGYFSLAEAHVSAYQSVHRRGAVYHIEGNFLWFALKQSVPQNER